MSERNPQTGPRLAAQFVRADDPLVVERDALESEVIKLRAEVERRRTESKVLTVRATGLRDLCGRLREKVEKARSELAEATASTAGDVNGAAQASELRELESELIKLGFDLHWVSDAQKDAAGEAEDEGDED